MFYLTRQERFTLLGLGVLIFTGAILRYFGLPVLDDNSLRSKQVVTSTLGRSTIDLNKASLLQLQEIPGVGPVTAGRIIEYREQFGSFKDVKDLKKVKGIGEKKILAIKDYVFF